METFTVDRMVVETGQTEQSQLISISVLFFLHMPTLQDQMLQVLKLSKKK